MGLIQPIIIAHSAGLDWNLNDVRNAVMTAFSKSDKSALRIIVGPEFLFSELDTSNRKYVALGPYDKRNDLLELLQFLSTQALVVPGTIVGRENRKPVNYAPVYFGGNEIQRVYKQGVGGNTEWQWYKPTYPLAPENPDTFVLNYNKNSETRFGVEICTDNGTMQADLKNRNNNKLQYWPEVYIMPSYGMANENICYYANDLLAYKSFGKKNEIHWCSENYDIDLPKLLRTSEIGMFALHKIKPGVFIQSDGNAFRVGLKSCLGEKFKLLMPQCSWPCGKVTRLSSDHQMYVTAVHLFPKIEMTYDLVKVVK